MEADVDEQIEVNVYMYARRGEDRVHNDALARLRRGGEKVRLYCSAMSGVTFDLREPAPRPMMKMATTKHARTLPERAITLGRRYGRRNAYSLVEPPPRI